MTNPFYNHGTTPATNSSGSSSLVRAEFDAITAGFALLPAALTAGGFVVGNVGGSALTMSSNISESGTTVTVGGILVATANAASVVSKANLLATARAINGVNFDGSAPITIADATKLPLAGGAMSGPVTSSSSWTGTGFTATSDGGGYTTKLATTAGDAGLTVQDQGGSRKIELLFAGSTNGGFYGITPGNSVLNFNSGNFTMSFGDVAKHAFSSTGAVTLNNTLTVTAAGLVLDAPAGNTFQPTVRAAKAAGTSRNLNAVTTADPDLQVALGVGTWSIGGFIPVSTGAGGLKTGMAFTGTQTNNVYSIIGSMNNVSFTMIALPFTNGVAQSTGSGTDWIELRGTVTVTVAGTLQFLWAQNSSNAANTTVLTGAYLACTKVG